MKDIEDLSKSEIQNLKDKLIETARDKIDLDISYILLLVFSTIIATLGLLTNSSAVVIGAMLISPLFGPILGTTVSIMVIRKNFGRDALFSLLVSIIIVLVTSVLVAQLSPIHEVTYEISSRVNPTLLDLFIAFSAAVIGVFAIYFPKISESGTGVAISISLLPPLCVSGIGIAFGDPAIFLGSFLLFASNMGAIIFIGAITLYVFKFRPKYRKEAERMRSGLLISGFFLLLISIPLTFFLLGAIEQTNIQRHVNHILTEEIETLDSTAKLEDLQVNFSKISGKDAVEVSVNLYLPESINISESYKNNLVKLLTDDLNKTVKLEVDVLNTISLMREEDQELMQLRQNIQNIFFQKVREVNQNINIDNINIDFQKSDENFQEFDFVSISVVIKQYEKVPLTYEQKEQITDYISNQIGKNVVLDIELVPIKKLEQVDEETKLRNKANSDLEQILIGISKDIRMSGDFDSFIINLDEDLVLAEVVIYIPNSSFLSMQEKETIESQLAESLGKRVSLELVQISYRSY